MGQEEAGMSMREVIDAAQGKWPEILRKYGVEEKFLRNAHGPCPICAGKDRFRFDDKNGFGTYYCSNCGAGYGLDLLAGITGRSKKDLADELAPLVGSLPATSWTAAPDMRKRIEWITAHLRHASAVPEVIAYLKGRGLKPASDTFALPAVRYYDERKLVGEFAAMVTRFCAPSGELITYHLTHVQGGRKAPVPSPRKVLTPLGPMAGGALRLTRVYPHLGLAEGVETALAVMRDFRLPCWAAANAGMLEKFTPPAGVEAVTVFADNDASFTGQRAAFALAHRLKGLNIAVKVEIPGQVGDFADRNPAVTKEAAGVR
jgi:putative DNA primase/helicase